MPIKCPSNARQSLTTSHTMTSGKASFESVVKREVEFIAFYLDTHVGAPHHHPRNRGMMAGWICHFLSCFPRRAEFCPTGNAPNLPRVTLSHRGRAAMIE